jgi:hypothetical protein
MYITKGNIQKYGGNIVFTNTYDDAFANGFVCSR